MISTNNTQKNVYKALLYLVVQDVLASIIFAVLVYVHHMQNTEAKSLFRHSDVENIFHQLLGKR